MMTITRSIQDDYEKIIIWDLFNESKGEYYGEPCLSFPLAKYDSLWDNEKYVFKFLKGLKKGKNSKIEELKTFCKTNDFDYSYYHEILVKMYKTTKKLGWWEKQIKKKKN